MVSPATSTSACLKLGNPFCSPDGSELTFHSKENELGRAGDGTAAAVALIWYHHTSSVCWGDDREAFHRETYLQTPSIQGIRFSQQLWQNILIYFLKYIPT